MLRVLLSLLAILSLGGCSKPGDSAARRAHELLEAGRFEEARTLIDSPLFKKISADPTSPKDVKLAAAKALDLLSKPADQP